MKKLFILILLITPLSVLAQTSFSGNWKLDTTKSDFKDAGGQEKTGASVFIMIHDSQDTLHITYKRADGGTSSYAYPLNGSPKQVHSENGNRKENKSLSLSWDKSKSQLSLKTTSQVDDSRQWTYTKTDVFSISSDGKILTRKTTSVLPDHTLQMTLIYHKE